MMNIGFEASHAFADVTNPIRVEHSKNNEHVISKNEFGKLLSDWLLELDF